MTAPKPHILLVEDHAATGTAVRNYLQTVGYTVHLSSDVRSARKYAASHDFDLLLCDIGLPDGTGWDLMRHLRRKGEVVGIAISGFGREADVERSNAVGFARHLVKPLSPDELTDALDALSTVS